MRASLLFLLWEIIKIDNFLYKPALPPIFLILPLSRTLLRHLLSSHLRLPLPPCPGLRGASEAGAEGGGSCSQGSPQEDPGHPETAVGTGAADAAL